ncbi:MAG: hypothetical protein ACOCXG_00595 [Nanoarchaeota archaeon]
MVDFRAIIDKLQVIHFYDVILPFLLVYVIVYAILEKSKIFHVSGEGANNKHLKTVHTVISLVFGLFAIVSVQTVMHIQYLIVNIVLFIIFILVVLILLAFVFGDEYKQLLFDKDGTIKKWAAWTIGIIIFLVALGVLLYVTGALALIYDWLTDLNVNSSDVITVIVIIAIGFIIYMVSKSGSEENSNNNG